MKMRNVSLATFAFAALSAGNALAQSATQPAGSGPLLAAAEWVKGSLLGNVATAIAVVAIAVTGMMMLSGRINWRHGATVIIGCFILFGAATIVSGIQSAATVVR